MFIKHSLKLRFRNAKNFIHSSFKVKFNNIDEYLKYSGFKHVNDTQLMIEPAGYDYGSTDFHYYTFPLYEAINNYDPDLDLVELLLKGGADPNFQSESCSSTVLHTVLINDNWWNNNTIALLSLLIKYGADVNSRDKHENDTPLHQVAFSWTSPYAEGIIKLLIANGANPKFRNFMSKTPRHNVLSSHKWSHRKHLPLPRKILSLLNTSSKYNKE